MTLLTSFLLVLFIEGIQNLPAMVGVVTALGEKNPWRKYGFAMAGMLVASLVIATTEAIKLQGTTLPLPPDPTVIKIVRYGLMMGGTSWVFLFLSKWGNWKSDIVLGLLLGGLFPIAASSNDPQMYQTLRFWTHTASFIVTAVVLLAIFRKAKTASTLQEKGRLILMSTAVMTVLIVAIDYGPFLIR